MHLYKYRDATITGYIVEYKTDEHNKYVMLKKLKINGINMIIQVEEHQDVQLYGSQL